LLETLDELELVGNVAPLQLAIRLLIPARSRLLELQAVRESIGEFDERELSYRWRHADKRVERLYEAVTEIVQAGVKNRSSRHDIFLQVSVEAKFWAGGQRTWVKKKPIHCKPPIAVLTSRAAVPYLNEPWFC
jgi:hypothetical protein